MQNEVVYKPTILPFNVLRHGHISHSAGPGEFYVQLSENASQLEEVRNILNANKNKLRPISKMPQVGEALVSVFSQDGQLYRATMSGICKTDQHPPTIEVFFCDYGNYDEVAVNRVFEPFPEILSIPQLCFEASFDLKRQWKDEEIVKFDQQFPLEVAFPFKVLSSAGDFKRMKYQIMVEKSQPNRPPAQPSPQSSRSSVSPAQQETASQSAAPISSVPSMARSKLPDFTAVNLMIGSEYPVVLVSVTSFNSFGVQLKTHMDKFQELRDEMKEFYESEDNRQRLAIRLQNVKPGDAFATYLPDEEEWSRCYVQSQSSAANSYNLINIDYGDPVTRRVDELFELPLNLVKRLPIELVKCRLHNVDYGVGGKNQATRQLSDDSFLDLESWLENTCTDAEFSLTVNVVQESTINVLSREYSVILKAASKSRTLVINDVMRDKVKQLMQSEGLSPQPEVQQISAPRLPSLKAPEGRIKASVVFATSPKELYLVLERDEEEFTNVKTRMEALYTESVQKDKLEPIVGLLCAAKFEEDDCWYRATILEIGDASKCKVLFIDYGNRELVHVSNIRKLDGSLYQYPPFAIRCQLKKATGPGLDIWQQLPENRRDNFLEMILDRQFLVKFDDTASIGKDPNSVFLVSMTDDRGDDVFSYLSQPEPRSPPGKDGFDARQVITERQSNQPSPPNKPNGFDKTRLGPVTVHQSGSNFNATSPDKRRSAGIGFQNSGPPGPRNPMMSPTGRMDRPPRIDDFRASRGPDGPPDSRNRGEARQNNSFGQRDSTGSFGAPRSRDFGDERRGGSGFGQRSNDQRERQRNDGSDGFGDGNQRGFSKGFPGQGDGPPEFGRPRRLNSENSQGTFSGSKKLDGFGDKRDNFGGPKKFEGNDQSGGRMPREPRGPGSSSGRRFGSTSSDGSTAKSEGSSRRVEGERNRNVPTNRSSPSKPPPSQAPQVVVPKSGKGEVVPRFDLFLSSDVKVRCRVMHVESPSCFYLVMVDKIDDLNEKIKTYLTAEAANVTRPAQVDCGLCYLLPTGQKKGNRVEVVKDEGDSKKFEVFCCDVGSTRNSVAQERLLCLNRTLASIAKLAIKCRLHGVSGPVTIGDRENDWTLSGFNLFKDLVDRKDVEVLFVARDVASQCITVQVFIPQDENDKTVSQSLIEANFAVANAADDELENANHVEKKLPISECAISESGKVWKGDLLCCESDRIWVRACDSVVKIQALESKLKEFFGRASSSSSMDGYEIKNPQIDTIYTTVIDETFKRCVFLESAEKLTVRLIDHGYCESVAKVYAYPQCVESEPVFAQYVALDSDMFLESLMTPFAMHILNHRNRSKPCTVSLTLKSCEDKLLATSVVLDSESFGDILLRLNSKPFVENLNTFEADDVKLQMIEVLDHFSGDGSHQKVFSALPVDEAEKRDQFSQRLNQMYTKWDHESLLSDRVTGNPLKCEEYELSLGSFVVVRVTDSETATEIVYKRAEVINVKNEGKEVDLFCVDYGTVISSDVDQLRKLVPEFCTPDKPAFTMQCVVVDDEEAKVPELATGQEVVQVKLLHLGRLNVVALGLDYQGVNQEPCLNFPRLNEVDLNKQRISICSLRSPIDISFKLSRFESELSNVSLELEMLWSDLEALDVSELVIDEQKLIAYLWKGTYCRAKIVSVNIEEADETAESKVLSIDLKLIDFDIEETVTSANFENVKKLPNYLGALPVSCGKLSVPGVVPLEGNKFVEIEKQIAEKVLSGHVRCIDKFESGAILFNGKDYAQFLIDYEVAKSEKTQSTAVVTYEVSDLEIEQQKDSLIVSAVDDAYIWVQLPSTQERIDKVQGKLAEVYTDAYIAQPEAKLRRPKPGKACVARFSDDLCWYRAEIIDCSEDDKTVSVRFVDFGNTEKTAADNLCAWNKDLCAQVLAEPKFAVRIELEDMAELMNFDVLEHLQETLVSQSVSTDELNVDNQETKVLSVKVNRLYLNKESVIDLIKFVKRNPKVSELCMKEIRSINAKVSHIEKQSETVKFFVQEVGKAEELAALMDEIRRVYEEIDGDKLKIEALCENEFLVVKWEEDGEFYRAKLMESLPDQFRVLLVDYGNVVDCKKESCWKLDRKFSAQSPFAFCCSLFNCAPKDDQSLAQIVEYLESELLGNSENDESSEEQEKHCKCEFELRVSEPYLVDIMLENEAWVTEVLKEKGLVQSDDETAGDLRFLPNAEITEQARPCFVLSTVSPKSIGLQLAGEENKSFEILQEDLNQFYANDAPENPEDALYAVSKDGLAEGGLVIAYDEEFDSYCRSYIQSTSDSGIEVFLVDWARSITVSVESLKQIKHEFVNVLRPQSLIVQLAGVVPDEDEEYLESDELVIATVVAENEVLVSLSSSQQPKEGYPAVDIKILPDKSDLAEMLINEKICRSAFDHSEIIWPKVKQDDSLTEDLNAQPICVASIDKSGFYAQFESNIEAVANLLAAYATDTGLRKVLRRPKPGKFCVTKFEEDDQYYRAEITDVNYDSKIASVVFVDYRNEQKTKIEEVFEMTPELFEIPSCCVRFQFTAEVRNVINWDVLRELESTITLNAEMPKSCCVEVLDRKDLIANLTVENRTLFEVIQKIREHLIVPLESFSCRETSNVLMSNFESVESLFVIPAGNIEKRENFNAEMTKFYNHLSEPKEQLKIEALEFKPGCHIAFNLISDANPLDTKWCRAEVEEVHLGDSDFESSTCSLRLLDTGALLLNCKVSRCKKLEKSFTLQETFSIHCKLMQVYTKKDLDDGLVSKKVVELTKAIDRVPFKLQVASRTSFPQAVDIILPEGAACEALTEALIGEDLVDTKVSDDSKLSLNSETLLSARREARKVAVTFIESVSPAAITLQLVDSNEQLVMLEDDVEHAIEKLDSVSESEIEEISVCIALSTDDNRWYRAKVESYESSEANVTFVDWSNTSKVELKSLRKIPVEFCEFPIQAVKVSLDEVIPIEGSEWAEDDNEYLTEILSTANQLHLYLKDEPSVDLSRPLLADLFVDEGKCLASELKAMHVAREPGSPEAELKKPPRSRFSLEENSEVVLWISAVEPVNYEWKAVDDKPAKWSKISGETADETSLDKNFIWVQLDGLDAELQELNGLIGKNCAKYRKLYRPKAGKLAAIKSHFLDCWIRVKLLKFDEEAKLWIVLAVDYGHKETVESVECLKQIPESLWTKPCFALSMAVEDLDLDELDIECIEELQNTIVFNESEEVIAHVTSVDEGSHFPVVIGSLSFRNQSLKFVVQKLTQPVIVEAQTPEEFVRENFDRVKCILSHVDSSEKLFLQNVEAWKDLNKMLQDMNSFYSDVSPERYCLGIFEEGMYCAFKSETNWFRGRVLESTETQVKVLDVDSGKQFFVPTANIKRLKTDFSQKAFAIEVSLFGVQAKPEVQSIVDAVESLVPASGEVLVHFMLSTADENKVLISMDKSTDLSSYLIESELAIPSQVQKEFSLEDSSAEIKDGCTVQCVFVQVETPEKILLQIESTNEKLVQLEQDLSAFYSIDKLRNALSFDNSDNLIGCACAFKSNVDALWHRGIVESSGESNESEEFQIFLVDWGSRESMKKEELFPLLSTFVSTIGAQSLIVNLASIEPDEPGESWVLPEDADELSGILESSETLTAQIALFESKSRVAVADILLDGGVSVCDVAVNENKFASFKQSGNKEPKPVEKLFDLDRERFSTPDWMDLEVKFLDSSILIGSLVSCEGKADELLQAINDLVAEKGSEQLLKRMRRIKQGKQGIVLHSDGQYYRAEVDEVTKNEDKIVDVKVLLVDYGEYCSLPEGNCFQPTSGSDLDNLVRKEPQYCVKLAHRIDKMSQEIVDEIWDFITDEKGLAAIQAKNILEDDAIELKLKSGDESLEDFVKSFYCPIQKLNCEIEPVDEKGFIDAAISYSDTDCFYLQLNKDLETLVLIQSGLDEKYGQLNIETTTTFAVEAGLAKKGSIVSCKCSLDGKWYRAEILEEASESEDFKVRMIDYGFVDSVKLQELRILNRHFHGFHRMAVPCVLEEEADIIVRAEDGGYQSDDLQALIQNHVVDKEADKLQALVNHSATLPWKISFKFRTLPEGILSGDDGTKTLCEVLMAMRD